MEIEKINLRLRISAWVKSPATGLAVALLIAGALGLFIGNDYGSGSDEALNRTVGSRALRAYANLGGYQDYLETGELLAHHGPSYFMTFVAFSRFATSVLSGWHTVDGLHLANYFTFLLGLVMFYGLCKRLLPKRIAWMTAALFATQPVLFGTGFINQKDMPFMVFFMATIAAGIWVAERQQAFSSATATESGEPPRSTWELVRRDWEGAGQRRKWALILLSVLFIAVALDVLVFDYLLRALESALVLVYGAREWEPINRLFALVAQDAYKTPVEGYFSKLAWGYWVIGRITGLVLALLLFTSAAKRALPRTMQRVLPADRSVLLFTLLAAFFQGFALSIRPVAGFAGLLVSGYWIHRMKERSAGPLLIFWVTAGIVCYQTWPYLWEAPLASFVESLGYTTDFVSHDVLYRGAVFRSDSLPWHYLPTLFTLQLTEPVIPLLAIGLASVLIARRRLGMDRAILAVVSLWFLVPFAGTFLPGSVQFNGLRHVLFLIPPLLITAGIGLKQIFDLLRPLAAKLLLAGLLLAPGVWGIVSLHPYEYAYFNAYAGGIDGAHGVYDQEYWCTSYREAMAYVNRVAEPGATIFTRRPLYSAIPFARPDQQLTNQIEAIEEASYLLFCARYPQDYVWVRGEKAFEVRRGSAVFAQVYQAEPSLNEIQEE